MTIDEIKNYLSSECSKRGWAIDKFSGPKKEGIPDCVIKATGEILIYVELKAPGKIATSLQMNDQHGVQVFVVDSEENVDVLLSTIQRIVEA